MSEERKQPKIEETEAGETQNDAPDLEPFEALVETVEGLRRERDDFYDQLLRKQAEFENYRKRVLREREETWTAAQAEMIREFLSVVDACEQGLRALAEEDHRDERLRRYREGYELLYRQIQNFLEKFRVRPVAGVGAQFDPNVHEAVTREVTGEYRDGEILEEYRRGYRIGERLLRPAQVKVAVRPREVSFAEPRNDEGDG